MGSGNFDWLDKFLEENKETFIESAEEQEDTEEGTETFDESGEGSDDSGTDQVIQEECDFSEMSELVSYYEESGLDKGKLKAFKEKTKARLKTICDTIIQKIKEVIAAMKLKMSQASLKAEVRKLGKMAKADFKKAVYDKELNAIANAFCKGYGDYVIRVSKVYSDYVKGSITLDTLNKRHAAIWEAWSKEAAKLDEKLDHIASRTWTDAATTISVSAVVTQYENVMFGAFDRFKRESDKTEAIFKKISETPIPDKPIQEDGEDTAKTNPESIAAAANETASTASKGYTKASSSITRIMKMAASYGISAIQVVAGAGLVVGGVRSTADGIDNGSVSSTVLGIGSVAAGVNIVKDGTNAIKKTHDKYHSVMEEAEDLDTSDFDQLLADIAEA